MNDPAAWGDPADPAALLSCLRSVNAIRHGDFRLKSGEHSPVYVDLRGLIGYPDALRFVARALIVRLRTLRFDRITGPPYAALPLGVAIALEAGWPLMYARAAAKEYGTGRRIEGPYQAGETVAVVDDVITTGAAKLEAIAPLREAGLTVRDIVVVVDREQGGAEQMAAAGYAVHGLLTLSDVLRSAPR